MTITLPTISETTRAASLPSVEILTPSKARVTLENRSVIVSDLLGKGDTNTKLRKSSTRRYLTQGLSMLPWKLDGFGNVCPFASPTCAASCLNYCGLGSIFSSVQFGRYARRVLWHTEKTWFLTRLSQELTRETRKAHRKRKRLAVRLNVLSDIPWERFGIVDAHPMVTFYDYTKNPQRIGLVRPNYWVTFSRSERNEDYAIAALRKRHNVAVVFHNPEPYCGNRSKLQTLPKSWYGFDVLDGDKTDLRFTDVRGRSRGGKVIGLRLKAPNYRQRQIAIDGGFSIEHSG